MQPDEFRKHQAGSLRSGFTVICESRVRTIQEIQPRQFTVRIIFTDKFEITIPNETLLEVVKTKTGKKGK